MQKKNSIGEESDMSCVTVKEDNGLVEVILNRPEKHNSLSMEMFEELVSVGDRLMRDNTVKVVVLHGEGPSFCAGLDLSLMKEVADPSGGVVEKLLEVDEDGLSLAQRSAYIWKLIPRQLSVQFMAWLLVEVVKLH